MENAGDAQIVSGCSSGQLEEIPQEVDSKDNDVLVGSVCPFGQL